MWHRNRKIIMQNGKDYLVRAITSDGMVKAVAISSKGIVERARNIHKTSPLATAALGRALTAVSMMGNELKQDDGSVTFRIDGDGVLGTVVTVSDSTGNVRGYLQNPSADLPLREDGKLDVGGGIGQGNLTIIKDIGMKEPFTGSVELISGEIADDLAAYFHDSEQIPTVCALGVLVDRDYSVLAAGGYIIQLMPGADDDTISRVENGVIKSGAVSKLLSQGMTPEEILNSVLSDFEVTIEEKTEVEYRCACNRKKVVSALVSIGEKELRRISDEQENIEVTCQFCDNVYKFSRNDVEQILAEIKN